MWGMIQLYRDQTGNTAVDMHEVVKLARSMGWRLPPPPSEEERMVRLFSRAARQQSRRNKDTRRPYRVNHAYPSITVDGRQIMLWTDIDKAPRGPMDASLKLRRQGMVDDAYHLFCDADHWSAINPSEQPIKLIYNLEKDLAERLHAPPEEGEKAS